jgi:serine/threonine protein kinase
MRFASSRLSASEDDSTESTSQEGDTGPQITARSDRRKLARRVARKGISSRLRDHFHAVRWFVREAEITAQLDHPGIVPIHQLDADGSGHLYFTMKLVEGETLTKLVSDLAAPVSSWARTFTLLELTGKVCDALAFAHSRGVVHGDVKPDNVMVGRFGQCVPGLGPCPDWRDAAAAGRERGQHLDAGYRRARDHRHASLHVP